MLAAALGIIGSPQASERGGLGGGTEVTHSGRGVFLLRAAPTAGARVLDAVNATIDLRRIGHGYDPAVDPDVPKHTDVTIGPELAPLIDESGHEYALITLYQIDPPLSDLPSREQGIDRGIDMRSPADMIKSAYSNYVSPVYTEDADRVAVANHPIGHFYVKLQLGGYPMLQTGMTTIRRADDELVDLTFGRGLGIGGVLLTPQPGRLNAAAEVRHELDLRQRRLRVVDGLYYRQEDGRNQGPEYLIEDGNVVFARFKVPALNAKDAVAAFVQYIWQGQHRQFGSLLSRPYKGSGAGCSAFAMSWLKAAGVIPFVQEPSEGRAADENSTLPVGAEDFWKTLYRTVHVPWDHLGCDQRLGASQPIPAAYTIYDLLFHHEPSSHLVRAVPGLAQQIKKDHGVITATLFEFGALTPLRDLLIAIKRKDRSDTGSYRWAAPGDGLRVSFWDNGAFSRWVKQLWLTGQPPERIKLVKEGRFLGIEIDAMAVPQRRESFFATADRLMQSRPRNAPQMMAPGSCQPLFEAGLR